MCCFLGALVFAAPRLCLFILWLFTFYIGRAFSTLLWPVLGFFFMPYTTLAYAVAMNEGGGLRGLWMAVFILGVLMDFGAFGSVNASRRRGPGGHAHEIDHGA